MAGKDKKWWQPCRQFTSFPYAAMLKKNFGNPRLLPLGQQHLEELASQADLALEGRQARVTARVGILIQRVVDIGCLVSGI